MRFVDPFDHGLKWPSAIADGRQTTCLSSSHFCRRSQNVASCSHSLMQLSLNGMLRSQFNSYKRAKA